MRSKYISGKENFILDTLKSDPSRHYTADDIYELAKKAKFIISFPTIYRRIKMLISEGVIIKYESTDSDKASFGYNVNLIDYKGYHIFCTKCKTLAYIECDVVDSFSFHLLNSHKFQLDKARTVFYGQCEKCST
ncbi:MAG: transcriptional repressor [Christensenellaceae bacterium]|jgi:Fur family ferric uptake transcriptional regulator|nr:transcriptional repressor [Christensenellaceae bacterium]